MAVKKTPYAKLDIRANHTGGAILILDDTGIGGGHFVGSIRKTARQEFTAFSHKHSLKGITGVHGASLQDVSDRLQLKAKQGLIFSQKDGSL